MISNKEDYKEYLQSDLRSAKIQKWKWQFRYKHEILKFQRLLRKIEYYQNCKNDLFSKIHLLFLKYRYKKISLKMGFTIPKNVFGPGLSIPHYGTIIVNPRAKVGKNCRIHASTNIGEINGEAPIIGNNVYIGPGAKLYGAITVGNNVAIGANAVVNKSIPDNVTVGGVPAKIISEKSSKAMIVEGHK
ncbi:serine O-acetyltransferase [Peribacillus frigoritolerans]|uniref:serine O-acetyltransferase n=1 Tax=Peribacillus castrilensis TaxID=2897690 RepID=UPI002DCA1937|nr:serine acetyltransferase [Peribacillus castrilensis]